MTEAIAEVRPGPPQLQNPWTLAFAPELEREICDAMAMLLEIWGCKALCVAGGAKAGDSLRRLMAAHLRAVRPATEAKS